MLRHNAECHHSERRVLSIIMLNVIMLSVVAPCFQLQGLGAQDPSVFYQHFV